MKKHLRYAVALWAMLFLAAQAYAQGTVQGTVTDDKGEPLIGATIMVVGTSKGTATDFDGNYILEDMPAGEQQLRASYTGFADKTLTANVVSGRAVTLNFQLGEDIEILEEVVVIGYGSVKKGDATGVVTAISEKDFNRGAIVSPDQLIAGKVAGVQISTNSGEPGGGARVRIRGGTSINASNEPLYVIDGVPIDNEGIGSGRNPLNFLNPSDIETFTVLKDASATAIYGSRGANGVIIITTKKGKAGGRTQLAYDGYYTTSSILSEPAIFDAESFRNVVTFKAPERLNQMGNANTNWYDEMLRTAAGQNHSLSLTGGAENIGYRVSVGYQQLEGIVAPSETERTSVALNYNHDLLDGRLKLNTNVKGSFTKDRFDPGQVGSAWSFDPTHPVFDPDNTAFAGFFEYGVALSPRNPVSAAQQIDNVGQNFRSIGNIELEYDLSGFLLDGLSVKTNLGYDVTNGQVRRFNPTTYLRPPVSDRTGEIFIENPYRLNKLLDAYVVYKPTMGGSHSFDFTAGYSFQDFTEEYPSFTAFDLDGDAFGTNSTSPATEFTTYNTFIQNRLISFFGRVNYSFANKYLLTATLRRDGSTRFGPDNRWGWFPSAAFAWRILEEDFASGLQGVLSDLKLRLGYGITGNQDITDFGYLPTYRFSDFRARYQFGDGFVTTVRPDAYDANLKWEETSSYNAGLDFGFANGRIRGALEYYYKRTEDLLFVVNVPAGTNLSDRVLTNIGEVENQGIELTLDAVVVDNRAKGLSWNLGFNVARNQNEVLEIDRISEQGVLTGNIEGGVGNQVQIHQVGSPVSSFYLYEHKLGANGLPLPDGVDHNEDGVVNLADIYQDQNGDGTVNDLDKRVIEQPAPTVILGLTSSLFYKGFDLSFTLRGSLGNYVYNNNASARGWWNNLTVNPNFLNNLHTSVLETNFTTAQFFSDYYLEDASFLRMDNITLGYTLNPEAVLNSVRLYATAQNLFVLSNYSGMDPEVPNGIDRNPFPRARSIIVGLSLGL